METVLTIGIGARVMLRRNLAVEVGLMNGSVGTVTDIVRNNSGVVTGIIVNFDNVGHHLIRHVHVEYTLAGNVKRTRMQFPLMLAYSATVHRAQGM